MKVAGKLRGIFTDLKGQHVLDVIESSTKSEVVRWLSGLEGRDTLVEVCIDGQAPYRDAVREVFGRNAQIVSDKSQILMTVIISALG